MIARGRTPREGGERRGVWPDAQPRPQACCKRAHPAARAPVAGRPGRRGVVADVARDLRGTDDVAEEAAVIAGVEDRDGARGLDEFDADAAGALDE